MTDTNSIANLVAKLSLDTSGFVSAASAIDASSVQKSVQNAVDDIEIDIRNFTLASEADELRETNEQLSRLQDFQDDALDLGTKIFKAGIETISTAKNIETAWAKVKTAVSVPPEIDADAYFKGLKNEAYQLSTEIPEVLSVIMQTMQAAGKADVDAESIGSFTKAVLQLQEASGNTFKVESIIPYFNQLHSLTSASYDDAERWGSALVSLAQKTTASEKDIMSAAASIAAIGNAANMSVPEILGWGAYMAEVGGVSDKTFQKIVSNVDDGTGDITGNINSLLKSLEQMRLDDIANSTNTYNEALKELGLDSRLYADDMAKLTANTDSLASDLKTANNAFAENLSLTEAAATATDTLDAQLLMFQNTITAIQSQLGDALLPILKDIGEVLLPILQGVTKFIADHPGLAGTITGVAIAFEGLAIAAQFASVAMAMGTIGLAPWIGAVAIIGAVVGAVVLLADAFKNSHEMASATLEDIENMNPAVDNLTEIAGTMYITPKFVNTESAVDIYGEEFDVGTWVQWDDWKEGWVLATEEEIAILNDRLNETTILASDVSNAFTENSAGEQLAESVGSTEEAVTDTANIMDRLNEQMSAFDDLTGQLSDSMDNDLGSSMEQLNQMLESEAFRQFANEPVDPAVGESWTAFGDAVSKAGEGFSSITAMLGGTGEIGKGNAVDVSGAIKPIGTDTLESYQEFAAALTKINTVIGTTAEEGAAGASGAAAGGTGLIVAMSMLAKEINAVYAESKCLAEYWTGTMPLAVQTLVEALCVVTTNDEGEQQANGGNTLYNALGSIYGLLQDITASSRVLVEHWTGAFPAGIELLKIKVGEGIAALESMDGSVTGLTDHFYTLTAAIGEALDAFLKFQGYTGKGGGGNGYSNIPLRAKGGPVRADESYWVGEEGIPELFTPNRNGYITPLEDLMSASGGREEPTVVINFEGDVIGNERSIRDLVTKAVKAGIRQEVRSAV